MDDTDLDIITEALDDVAMPHEVVPVENGSLVKFGRWTFTFDCRGNVTSAEREK